ncbi:protein MIZU-KUSSEI 1-like [Rutidosis leptorrhynchoides]|uniref:protein MIZU-KUSSEI 1-like n=1 Tax=Rutidosis leptorrhynchoides TaxID=125765 RepID=UPI003A992891
MAKISLDKKHFHWSNKVSNEDEEEQEGSNSLHTHFQKNQQTELPSSLTRKKLQTITIARVRSVLTAMNKNRANLLHGLGPRVVGTLFGSRKGHVHFVFQKTPTSQPAFLIELQTPISGLVKEMASGLVRIALECDKEDDKIKKGGNLKKILDEPIWRTYCNGKKCGFAMKRECGEKEWKVLKAVEPISMGAGVLPSEKASDHEHESLVHEDEIMYMRAKFERVVGSRDSEAFYMMNPDSNGAPELSIYLLRI